MSIAHEIGVSSAWKCYIMLYYVITTDIELIKMENSIRENVMLPQGTQGNEALHYHLYLA